MALPLNELGRLAAWEAVKNFLREQEDERRRLLGLWVSELEPVFVYSQFGMQLIGITVSGWDSVLIYAKGWTRAAQRSHDWWMTEAFRTATYPAAVFEWVGVDYGVAPGITINIEDLRITPSDIRRGLQVDYSRVDMSKVPK
jgi:hypothetical protein